MSDVPAPLVTVVVPAFNEADVIDDTLTRLVAHLGTLEPTFRWEIVVVDDGSTDATGKIADDFARDHAGIRVLRHVTNRRLGEALRHGFREAAGDYVAVVDCDLSYAPDDIARMLQAAQDTGAPIVVASPYMKGGTTTNVPFARRALSRGANRLLAAVAGGGLTTLTGMVRVYDGPFIRSLTLRAVDADINVEIIYEARILQARIVEVPAQLDWSFTATDGHRRAVDARLAAATVALLFWAFRLARQRTNGLAAGPARGTKGDGRGGR